MKYRPHKGSLADSMAEMVEVDGRVGLVAQLRKEFEMWPTLLPLAEKVYATPYFGPDDRIGWNDVWIITLDGYGVVGFCDGPP